MKKLFNNILLPVDSGKDAEPFVKEVIDLANQFHCNVHLVCMQPEYDCRLTELKQRFRADLHPPLSLYTSVQTGNVENALVTYSIKHQVDLLVLPHRRKSVIGDFFGEVNINRLSKKIRCPLLTFRKNANLENLNNIVLPVGESLPVRKLMFAAYLAKKYSSTLHLIAIPGTDEENKNGNAYLSKAYRLVREDIEIPVECRVFPEGNLADLTLSYAKTIKADLIIVNPGKESSMSGYANLIFPRSLTNSSRIAVLTC